MEDGTGYVLHVNLIGETFKTNIAEAANAFEEAIVRLGGAVEKTSG